MTLQDLKNNRDSIIAEYYELGGVQNMLIEFMTTLKQAVEFELNESEDTSKLVKQFFNSRYQESGGASARDAFGILWRINFRERKKLCRMRR